MAKRSLSVAGHRTSVSLEEPFWDALAEIASARRSSVAALVASIDRDRSGPTNLSAAIRIYVLEWYRGRATGTAPIAAEQSRAVGRRRAPRERG